MLNFIILKHKSQPPQQLFFKALIKTLFALSLYLLTSSIICSQELEPRNYSCIPVGLNAAALSYVYSSGDVIADATAPIQGLELNSNVIGVGYLRSFNVFGRLLKIQAAVPYLLMNGNATVNGVVTEGSRSGFADIKMKVVYGLAGTPALTPQQFVKYKETFILGASLSVNFPTGQYFPEKLVNIGSNRWGFKPEVGMSYRYNKFLFELFSGVWFTTDNKDFLVNKTLHQNPILSAQGHISYMFTPKLLIGVNTVYVNGGETSVDGIERNDFQKNFRGGATLNYSFSPHHSVKASYSSGISTRIGGDFNNYGLTYQYIWF